MNNLTIFKTTFFFFFFQLHSITIAISKPSYTPTDLILVNCGSSDETASEYGRTWTGDLNSKFVPIETSNNKSTPATSLLQDSSVVSVPYMTARISRTQFMYTFPVTAGQKFIRLYFYPSLYQGFNRSKGFFDVRAGPYTLLRNFSAALYADNWGEGYETFIREFCINVEESEQLNITFAPSLNDSNDSYAFINGIEIVSMPTNLYYTPPDGVGITFIGQNRQFYVQNDTALQKICRLNVGGSSISPRDDTGMYRLWNDDWIYFYPRYGVMPREPNISLIYSKIPQYIAPAVLYQSARSMGTNRNENLLTNLTWQVPVDPGFRYLVRLHFCEIVSEVTEVNDRRFIIFIDNQTAEAGFDVFESSGGRNIPMYKDYIVTAGKKEETSDYIIFITMHPINSSAYADAILNGLEVFKLSNSDRSLAGQNSAPSVSPAPALAPVQPLPTSKMSNTKKILLIAVVGSVIGLLIILSLLCCLIIWKVRTRKRYGSYYDSLSCCWWLSHQEEKSSRTRASSLPDELCSRFSLDEIKAATNNFDEKLIRGVGGFGNVYEGDVDTRVVAIKRLKPESGQGGQEFKTEIKMLSQLRHVHLVSLIGYCNDGGEMILVYDYMINGTLQDHLYGTNKDPLPWKQRLEICVGAARGLHYLHSGATHTIIHRDVKTSNILLDKNWVAKVSDFGLSKTGSNNTAVSTLVKGTWGYLDPEYARCQHLTDKSDVYSFGAVLFEVLCARKPLNQKFPEEQWNLVSWTRKCIQNGTIHEIIDPYLMGRIAPECFNKFVEIAESCVREQGIDRPTMRDVMEKLQFALQLQEAADAKQEGINPGGEYVYSEISFQAPRYTNVVGEPEQDSSTASGLTTFKTNTTGMTFPSLESSSMTSSYGFVDTTNSTA